MSSLVGLPTSSSAGTKSRPGQPPCNIYLLIGRSTSSRGVAMGSLLIIGHKKYKRDKSGVFFSVGIAFVYENPPQNIYTARLHIQQTGTNVSFGALQKGQIFCGLPKVRGCLTSFWGGAGFAGFSMTSVSSSAGTSSCRSPPEKKFLNLLHQPDIVSPFYWW